MTEKPGMMRVTARELERIGSRRLYPMLLFVLPLVSFALLWTIFSAGVIREMPIAVVDLDGTPLSRRLVRLLDADPSLTVSHRPDSGRAAEQLMLTGKVYGIVLIPQDLERDVYSGESAVVTVYRNAQIMSPSSIIRRSTLSAVGTLSAGIEVHQRMARGETFGQAMETYEPIRFDGHPLFNPWLNYIYFLVSSLLPTMLQIFIVVTSVHAVGVELKDRTGREWLDAAGGSVVRAVAGKLLPYAVAYSVLAIFMLSVTLKFMGVPFHGDLPVLVLGTLLFVFASQGLGVAIAACFANLRLATSAAAFLTSPAFAFAGLTFPTDAMPPFAAAWSQLIPLTHYLRIFVEQIMRGAPVSTSLPELTILAAFAVLTPLLAQPRLARVLSDERYWGRT